LGNVEGIPLGVYESELERQQGLKKKEFFCSFYGKKESLNFNVERVEYKISTAFFNKVFNLFI